MLHKTLYRKPSKSKGNNSFNSGCFSILYSHNNSSILAGQAEMRTFKFTSVFAPVLAGVSLAQISPKQYVDDATGINFLGFADGTGYQFGMALPQNQSADAILQIISPLNNGGGWGGINFGETMLGKLMVVTWPNDQQVMLSPRIATGYEITTGANPYSQDSLTLNRITRGTFVNSTHVSATFVCGGCINSDSFSVSDSSATFAYAYAKEPVATPSDPTTKLSDHTSHGEPYASFDISLKDAQVASYAAWAQMIGGKHSNTSSGENSTSSGTTSRSTTSGASSSASSSSSSTTTTVSSPDAVDIINYGGPVFYAMLTLVVLVYLAQPFIG
jgi:hypothetical protein